MNVIACGLHGFSEEIGIDVDDLRVYWKLHFVHERTKQAGYRVVISSDKDFNSSSEGVCFDSGRRASHEQRNIRCKPDNGFKSTTLYYWTVQVWDQDGNTTTSAINEFYTSYPRSSRLLPPYSMNQTYVCVQRNYRGLQF
jgi:hypothetical protein